MAYVWDRYDLGEGFATTSSAVGGGGMMFTYLSAGNIYASTSYTFDNTTGKYTLTNPTKYTKSDWVVEDNGDAKLYLNGQRYFMINASSATGSTMYYHQRYDRGYITGAYSDSYTKFTSTGTYVRNNINGSVSSDSASGYPTNGVNGSYWYIFRGAPSGITYQTDAATGDVIPISWSAGTNPVYYRVQRSNDGGVSWVTLSSVITGTSFTDESIVQDTVSPTFIYRVCTLGEAAESEYSTGAVLYVLRCNARIKVNGVWIIGTGTYQKINGVWTLLTIDQEPTVFSSGRKLKLATS